MTEYGRRGGGAGGGVGGDRVGRQDEAIVHIAGADDVLIHLVGFEIPSCCAADDPVRGDLDRRAAQNSFAASEVSECRLCGVIAVYHAYRPPVEARATFSFKAIDVQ